MARLKVWDGEAGEWRYVDLGQRGPQGDPGPPGPPGGPGPPGPAGAAAFADVDAGTVEQGGGAIVLDPSTHVRHAELGKVVLLEFRLVFADGTAGQAGQGVVWTPAALPNEAFIGWAPLALGVAHVFKAFVGREFVFPELVGAVPAFAFRSVDGSQLGSAHAMAPQDELTGQLWYESV